MKKSKEQPRGKLIIKGDLFGLLSELKEKGVTFTSGHEVEIDENGEWHNKRRIF